MDSEIFQGNALSAVDGKSRLSIPAFIRNALIPAEPRGIYLGVHGRAPCLTVYGETYSAFLVAEQERLRLKGEESRAGRCGEVGCVAHNLFLRGRSKWRQDRKL